MENKYLNVGYFVYHLFYINFFYFNIALKCFYLNYYSGFGASSNFLVSPSYSCNETQSKRRKNRKLRRKINTFVYLRGQDFERGSKSTHLLLTHCYRSTDEAMLLRKKHSVQSLSWSMSSILGSQRSSVNWISKLGKILLN